MKMIEERIAINSPAADIFNVYKDVSHWNDWDPDTKSSSISGPFEAKTKGRLEPTKGKEIAITLTSVKPNESFTAEGGIPMFKMIFEHELVPSGHETIAIHRVTFSGLLSFVLGPMIGKQIRQGLPKTMISLKKHVESKML